MARGLGKGCNAGAPQLMLKLAKCKWSHQNIDKYAGGARH